METMGMKNHDRESLMQPVTMEQASTRQPDRPVTAWVWTVVALVSEGRECTHANGDVSSISAGEQVTVTTDWINWMYEGGCRTPASPDTLLVRFGGLGLFGPEHPVLVKRLAFPMEYTFVSPTPPGSSYHACAAFDELILCPEQGGGRYYPTAECQDGSFTCAVETLEACSAQGGLACVFCPGPLCP
jgi:hypothetical protein